MAYCLWAFEQAGARRPSPWYDGCRSSRSCSAILRYALLLERATAAEPEDVVLGDRTLQVLGVVLARCASALGVHAAT